MASLPPAENEPLRRARLAGVQHKITRMGTADDGIVKMLPEHILVVPENAHAIATKINHKLQGSCRQCALALVLHDVGREIPETLGERIQWCSGSMKTRNHIVYSI